LLRHTLSCFTYGQYELTLAALDFTVHAHYTCELNFAFDQQSKVDLCIIGKFIVSMQSCDSDMYLGVNHFMCHKHQHLHIVVLSA